MVIKIDTTCCYCLQSFSSNISICIAVSWMAFRMIPLGCMEDNTYHGCYDGVLVMKAWRMLACLQFGFLLLFCAGYGGYGNSSGYFGGYFRCFSIINYIHHDWNVCPSDLHRDIYNSSKGIGHCLNQLDLPASLLRSKRHVIATSLVVFRKLKHVRRQTKWF